MGSADAGSGRPSGDEAVEVQVASTERRLRALLEGMLDPVLTIDPYGVIQEASRSVQDVFGYDPKALLGQNIKMIMPEPHRSRHDDYLAAYRETGETWILGRTREFEVVRADGTQIVCELSVSRVDVPGQEEPRFIGSFRDVTARKRAEAAVRESERRFRAIFDQEFQFVGLLETDGTVVEMNRAALESVGREREDVVGKPFWETPWWAHSSEDRERVRAAIQRAAAGDFVRFETSFVSAGGAEVSVDFSLKPILDEAGEVDLLLPEGRDVTRIVEAQRRETAMLRALATIGESASLLAHEIKNPITAIHLALRAVADKIGEDHRTVLEDLVSRMEKLERTMRRTLSFAGALKTQTRPCRPDDLLEEAAASLRPHLEHAGVRCGIDCDPDLPDVQADPDLVEEVLTNLLRNAIEVLEGGGRVELSAKGGERQVCLCVDDDGPGIADSLLGSLFKPFVSSKDGGTGLGLAICKKIVEAQGGSIAAGRSELGGASFLVRLPIAGVAQSGPEEENAATPCD